jgi:hypothetical protein
MALAVRALAVALLFSSSARQVSAVAFAGKVPAAIHNKAVSATKSAAPAASETPAYLQHIKVQKFCSYYGGKVNTEQYLFPADQGAIDAINRILDRAGIMNNFAVYAATVPNAIATMIGGKRAILYNQDFMIRLKDSDWSAVSILAHEIAHHIHGDTLQGQIGGNERREMEAQADRYSGFILEQMGASLDDAQTAVRAIPTDEATATHPAKSDRLAAITNGWMSAQQLGDKIRTVKDASGKPEMPTPQTKVTRIQTPRPSGPTLDLVAEIIIDNDDNRYFLSAGGSILFVTGFPSSKTTTFGRQIPSGNMRWAWCIQTQRGVYAVDGKGVIWAKSADGDDYVAIGHVTSMSASP